MKCNPLPLLVLLLAMGPAHAQELRTFSNAGGKSLEDRIVKYNYAERIVTLEKNGKIPLDTFGKADQEYILRWNMAEGFMSTLRFKTEVQQNSWARMKAEETITPYWMDAVQLPGKETPTHNVVMIDDYEEYNVVYLDAEGYAITLRNQNEFPIENIVVESKVYYEQEYYTIPDDMFSSMKKEYADTVVSNKVRFISETIPSIIPREEVVLHSECAIVVDQQVDRNALVSTTENENGDTMDGEDSTDGSESTAEVTATVDGFGEWNDHGRRRKGSVTGIWVRIGIKGPNGEMLWRETTDPASLSKKVSWEPAPPAK
ncbi:MAG: hypothetical protein K9M54_03140 [Kiritimatiellales bacterium]|nr:hypothetical protein [Kiritimatiellales bacterium]